MPMRTLPTEFLFGHASVTAALHANRRSMLRLLISRHAASTNTTKLAISLASNLEIPVVETTTKRLDRFVENRPHQGLVLETRPLEFEYAANLSEYDIESDKYTLETEKKPIEHIYKGDSFPLWLALDHIIDPQNFGAIIRSCYFMGVDGVMITSKRFAPPSPVCSKASAGALEMMNIYETDLPKFVRVSGKNGWQVIGTDLNTTKTKPIHQLGTLNAPTILLLGNEHVGIRKNLLEMCDHHVIIPGRSDGVVDSLNVSVAAGILLSQLLF